MAAIFIKARNQPGTPASVRTYRNLERCSYVTIVQSGTRWYLQGSDGATSFYFGPDAGYATIEEATTALDTLLSADF